MSHPEVFVSSSVHETEAVASCLFPRLRQGGVVALEGDLGVGKTQFVRGLVEALGGDPHQVHSPTFVLLHEYALGGGRRLFHLDAYRVGSEDFEAIGFDELLAQTREGDILAIEWPSRVAELIPEDAIAVRLEATSPSDRRIEVRAGVRP